MLLLICSISLILFVIDDYYGSKKIRSPEGAGYGLSLRRAQELLMDYGTGIRDGYFPLYIYSAPSELESVGGLPTSGFTGGYSYTATMWREVPLGQSICIINQ
jgi:hypothetical protein